VREASVPDRPSPLTRSPLSHSVTVDGVEVRYGIRGTGDRDLLLVHGSGAHHVWWHAVAPTLESTWRVISVDLSGHGDSGHRDDYAAGTWAEELMAVLSAARARRPVVAAHSLGGRVALLAASRQPQELAGLVLFDTGIWAPDHLLDRPLPPRTVRPARVHPSLEEARARFRLMPPQPQPPAGLLDPVAEYSLRAVDGGWVWKHDTGGFPTLYEEAIERAAASVTVPVAYVYGAVSSVVDSARAARAVSTIPDVTAVRLPGAHHHLMLEFPESCAALIEEFGSQHLTRALRAGPPDDGRWT
jgi:pimeloyl-ACP methyl ester carboxylesterase